MGVEPERARGSLETRSLEVAQQGVDGRGMRARGASHRVSDADDDALADVHIPAHERNLGHDMSILSPGSWSSRRCFSAFSMVRIVWPMVAPS